GQLHVAPDLAYRVLRQFDLRQQAGQVQPAGVDVGAGADRGFTRVHADGRTDVAAGNAEVERVQPEQAVLQKQVRVHVVQWQRWGVDARRPQPHVGIHRLQLVQFVRGVGQHASARRLLAGPGGEFGVGRLAPAGVGGAADETGQVVEVEPAGVEVRAQVGAWAAGVDVGIAGKVAVADGAGEPVVEPRA